MLHQTLTFHTEYFPLMTKLAVKGSLSLCMENRQGRERERKGKTEYFSEHKVLTMLINLSRDQEQRFVPLGYKLEGSSCKDLFGKREL